MDNIKNYTISNHALQRYAERIMEKEGIDVNRFVTLNEEKIKTDINKMIEYGDLIFSGKQFQKDGKGNVVDVYIKDTWVILVDGKAKTVITIYKIDLGLGDEFNNTYVYKMREKLNTAQEALESVKQQVETESDMYRKMIEESEAQIKEYRTMINNLEELCSGYKIILENNSVMATQANKNVTEIVNTLISKKEF